MFSNFIFNGINSKNFDVYCCYFDGVSGLEVIADNSMTEFQTEKTPLGNRWYIYDSVYAEPIQFKIRIVNMDESEMTVDKRRALTKWLCLRNQYSWFSIDKEGYEDIYFNVIISNPSVISIGRIIGMEFTITCDSSFGYSGLIKKSYQITTPNQVVPIICNTDDYNCIYPKMTITMNQNGSLIIVNNREVDHYDFRFDNLSNGEIITIDNENCIITSSLSSHTHLLSDFNKHWFRLLEGENEFVINGNCKIDLEYREIRKVGVGLP